MVFCIAHARGYSSVVTCSFWIFFFSLSNPLCLHGVVVPWHKMPRCGLIVFIVLQLNWLHACCTHTKHNMHLHLYLLFEGTRVHLFTCIYYTDYKRTAHARNTFNCIRFLFKRIPCAFLHLYLLFISLYNVCIAHCLSLKY